MIPIKTGSIEATSLFTPKTNQNNDNNYNGVEAIAPNNNSEANAPGVTEPTTATSSTQGNDQLEYDIDIRFGGDNGPNQNPLDTIK